MKAGRREFPRAVKVVIIKRAMRENGVIYCERCGLPTRKFQIDHVIADALGGQPVIENAELICDICYSVKNPKDASLAAKVKRQEAAHLSASMLKQKIKSRGFPQKDKREPKTALPPLALYE